MTTETKVTHTPGKWDLSDTGYLTNEGGRPVMSSADVADEGRKRICVVDIQAKAKRGHGWETPCAERDANALLIAAAPDMLEALERSMELLRLIRDKMPLAWESIIDLKPGTNSPSFLVDIWDANKAAIAKAGGAA